MNDPHVESIHYFIAHDDSVNYSNTNPLEYEDDMFHIQAAKDQVRFEPKNHYATEEDAKRAVEGRARRWEFEAALSQSSTQFKLVYAGVEIIDLNPPAPPEGVSLISATFRSPPATMQVRITKRVTEYPAPSSGWPPLDPDDPDALYMSSRLDLYRRGRELLGGAAYVCLTVLESSAAPGVKNREKKRKQTATHYRIAKDVLDKVGNLSSEKGGEEARKADGRSDEFTREETLFLEGSLKSFVRKAAEKAACPTGILPEITMNDLH